MKVEILKAFNHEGESVLLFPNSIVYISENKDKDCLGLHLVNGETVDYYGTLEGLLKWQKKSQPTV